MTITQRTTRDDAVALHRAGRLSEAIAAYEALLIDQPNSADLLGLLGIATEQMGDIGEAEHLLRRSLRDQNSIPLVYRNLNNLLGLLIESGRENDAQDAVQAIQLPAWPVEKQPDTVEQDTVLSLITALKDLKQIEKATVVANHITPLLGHDADFAMLAAELKHGSGKVEEALVLLTRNFGAGEEIPNLHALRAALAHELKDLSACKASSGRFAATMPTLLAEAKPSQKFVLAVFNKAPEFVHDFRQLGNHHYSGNFPSQLAMALADRFRFVSIFPESPSARSAMRELPRSALALNNVVNAEQLMTDGLLERVTEVEDSLGVKVINHPKLAMQATRQKNSERFANQPGISFPRVSRYLSEKQQRFLLIADIEDRYAYPLIVRTVFQQMGKGTWLINDRTDLEEALDTLDGAQFYAINYVSARHDNGFFRSMRVAFVNKRPIVIRADYSDDWNVRARRDLIRQNFYRNNPALLAQADQIVTDPERMLGKASLDKLHTIAQMMPLDIFGMDFDIMDNGELLVFEANATMNLLSTSPEGLDYPEEIEARLLDYLEDFFCGSARGL